jgi:hypothetical protein
LDASFRSTAGPVRPFLPFFMDAPFARDGLEMSLEDDKPFIIGGRPRRARSEGYFFFTGNCISEKMIIFPSFIFGFPV